MREMRKHGCERLPSERDLCRKYGVCRPTVQKALGYFLEKNLIVRRPGKGTFVRARALGRRPAVTEVQLVIRRDWEDWQGDPYFGQVVSGIHGALGRRPFRISIEKYSEDLLLRLQQAPHTASLWLSPERAEMKALTALADGDATVVALNRRVEHPGVYWAASDHEGAGEKVGAHLISLGHTRVLYLWPAHERSLFLPRDTGLRRMLARPGVEYRSAVLKQATEGLGHILSSAFAAAPGPLALLIHNGALLPALTACLEKLGKPIPEEVSLVSFGSDGETERLAVTSIRQRAEELGRRSVELATGKTPGETGMLLPCTLVEGRSVKRIETN